jgi:hypothetical protein
MYAFVAWREALLNISGILLTAKNGYNTTVGAQKMSISCTNMSSKYIE